MDFLSQLLPIIIYVLLIVLIILLIIIAIKSIKTMKKVDEIVDDVDKKLKALDGAFSIIETTTDKFTLITETIVSSITGFFTGLFGKKKNKDKIEEDE